MMYSLVAGDLEPDMELTAELNGSPRDLTTALSIQLRWFKPDGTESLVPLVAVDLSAGKVRRVWASGDTDMAGWHRGRIVITWPGEEPGTFPNDGSWIYWVVHPATP